MPLRPAATVVERGAGGANGQRTLGVDTRAWQTRARARPRPGRSNLAAALTHDAVLELFPALLALVCLLGILGQGEPTTQTLLDRVRAPGQGDTADQLEGPLTQMTQTEQAGLALLTDVVGALWSASGCVGAFGRALNRVNQVDEGRPVWKLRPLQRLLTLVGLVLLGLVVSGPVARAVGETVGLGSSAVTAWDLATWPVILAVVVLLVAMLCHATPNVRQPAFRWISLGAAIASVGPCVGTAHARRPGVAGCDAPLRGVCHPPSPRFGRWTPALAHLSGCLVRNAIFSTTREVTLRHCT
jgi:hypothetical protein